MNEQFGSSFKPVFEETVDAIIITDGSSEKIIDVNKAACELLGRDKNSIIETHLFNYFEDETLSEIKKTPSQITMYGSVLSDRKVKTKSGQLIPVDLTINTFSENGNNYVMTTLRDVSERIKYENEIVAMNEELSKTNASKDKLFSIIAHDLKNPISALMSLSEMMASESETISPEEVNEFTGMIKNLSKNTYELLENLLNWARVQTKNIEIEKKEIDVRDLVDKISEVLKPSANLKSISINNLVDADFKIYADENMINAVIRNLISNAIKFSKENSSIKIRTGTNKNMNQVTVSDEGVGMEESYVKDLFKVDVYTSRYGTKKEKGTGLGLVLCNEFVKLHDGNIIVKSEVNKGTEFRIQIPKEN